MKIPVLTNILNANNMVAEQNRKLLNEKKVYLVNLLASPGAGKTTFLIESIKHLKKDFSVAVIEGDIASNVDALKIESLGNPVVQINTGGSCHLNAPMIQQALESFDLDDIDVIFIENVGNLICPAGYKLGENISLVMNSTTEGDDKILKYPPIFQKSKALIINKTDLIPYLDYKMENIEESFKKINPGGPVFPLSSKTGEGFKPWIDWLKENVSAFRKDLE